MNAKNIQTNEFILCDYEKFYMDTKVHNDSQILLKVPFNRD